jgi:hypothetical protein
MSDVNVKFSYKRADEDFLLEPTFEKNTTLSLTYKGPKEIIVWADPFDGDPLANSLSHPTEQDRIEAIRTAGKNKSEIKEIVLDAEASDIQAMACWLINHSGERIDQVESDPDQFNKHEYETISYEFMEHTIEWERLKNPNPNDLYTIHFRDWDNDDVWDVDFIYRTINNDTVAEIMTKDRLHQVKWFAEEYDLGEEAEALAAEFISKATKFIKDVDKVRPWHLKEPNAAWAPKIPLALAKAIAEIKNSGLSYAYVPYDIGNAINQIEPTLFYRELHNG